MALKCHLDPGYTGLCMSRSIKAKYAEKSSMNSKTYIGIFVLSTAGQNFYTEESAINKSVSGSDLSSHSIGLAILSVVQTNVGLGALYAVADFEQGIWIVGSGRDCPTRCR